MARNVEIKARAPQPHEPSAIAERLSAELSETSEQMDVFFRTERGFSMIDRITPGPKVGTYSICTTDDPSALRTVLSAAYGEDVVVQKVRTLLLLGRTRIHIDRVDHLGDFVELEVVLDDGDAISDGMEEARSIMNQLGILESDLVEGAYADLLRAREPAR